MCLLLPNCTRLTSKICKQRNRRSTKSVSSLTCTTSSSSTLKVSCTLSFYLSLYFFRFCRHSQINHKVVFGTPIDRAQRRNFESSMTYRVGDTLFTIADIFHGILRGNRTSVWESFNESSLHQKRKAAFFSADCKQKAFSMIQKPDLRLLIAAHPQLWAPTPFAIFSLEDISEAGLSAIGRAFLARNTRRQENEGLCLSQFFILFKDDIGVSDEEGFLEQHQDWLKDYIHMDRDKSRVNFGFGVRWSRFI